MKYLLTIIGVYIMGALSQNYYADRLAFGNEYISLLKNCLMAHNLYCQQIK